MTTTSKEDEGDEVEAEEDPKSEQSILGAHGGVDQGVANPLTSGRQINNNKEEEEEESLIPEETTLALIVDRGVELQRVRKILHK
jgi:hypothetical protein